MRVGSTFAHCHEVLGVIFFMIQRRFITIVIFVVGLLWMGMRWTNIRVRPSQSLGIKNGRLAPLTERPNGICTYSDDDGRSMQPLMLEYPPQQAIELLKQVIRQMPRSRIVTSTDDYLHVECRSLLCAFVDDVEFAIDEAGKRIHFRSASRVGYSDLGVNRKRMEEFLRRYEQLRERLPK